MNRSIFSPSADRCRLLMAVVAGVVGLTAESGADSPPAPVVRPAREGAGSRPTEAGRPDRDGESGRRDQPGRPDGGGDGKGSREPFSRFLDATDPGRFHHRLDEIFGLDASDLSDRPEAPEIPEPVFIEFTRPLGDLKYANETNYLLFAPIGTGRGHIPVSHFFEFEYVVTDWNAVKVEFEFNRGVLETIEPGYQRTLGVGRNGNWVHGFQISPEIFPADKFVGGTTAYIFNWKPAKESKYSTSFWAGANRTLVQLPDRGIPTVGSTGPGLLRTGAGAPPHAGAAAADAGRPGVWRPLIVADAWYTLNKKVTVGVENDFYTSRKYGEYLVLPHVNWHPTERFLFQAGLGYYRLGPQSEAVFLCHVNLFNPTRRRPREPDQGAGGGEEAPRPRRRIFERWRGGG